MMRRMLPSESLLWVLISCEKLTLYALCRALSNELARLKRLMQAAGRSPRTSDFSSIMEDAPS